MTISYSSSSRFTSGCGQRVGSSERNSFCLDGHETSNNQLNNDDCFVGNGIGYSMASVDRIRNMAHSLSQRPPGNPGKVMINNTSYCWSIEMRLRRRHTWSSPKVLVRVWAFEPGSCQELCSRFVVAVPVIDVDVVPRTSVHADSNCSITCCFSGRTAKQQNTQHVQSNVAPRYVHTHTSRPFWWTQLNPTQYRHVEMIRQGKTSYRHCLHAYLVSSFELHKA